MSRPAVLILTALKHEKDALERRLSNQANVRFHVIGPAATRLPADDDLNDASAIIMAGLAGGLDPSLTCGDVVIDAESSWDGLDQAFRRVAIHTASRIVSSPAEKAAIFRQTGAAVVDMENALARALAVKLKTQFLGIRAVCDTANETLDPAISRLTDPAGDVSAGRVATTLFRRPLLIGDLLRLRSQSSLALRNLAAALNRILQG